MSSVSKMMQRLRGPSNRRRDDGDYLFNVYFLESNLRFGYLDHEDTDDDDMSSITSHSTTRTVDDNPGTGRLIDKHAYQAQGKELERAIFQIRSTLRSSDHISDISHSFHYSVNSFSTNSTVDDNPGPGRLIDKHVYQAFGRKLERAIFQIRSTLRSPDHISDISHSFHYSVSSHSTNSTVDDNPGPGRLIDKHFYQAFGRKLERAIFVIKSQNARPVEISMFFEKMAGPGSGDIYSDEEGDCIGCLGNHKHSIYSLNILLYQTQSSSLYRSAAALTSLIHVSTLCQSATSFYGAVSLDEPIYHVETLASSLYDLGPTKKYTFLLTNLARAHAIAIKNFNPPVKFAHDLKNEFLILLNTIRRTPAHIDPPELVGKACQIYARALSCMHQDFSGIDIQIMETIYLMLIFFLRSIHILYSEVKLSDPTSHRFIKMVLSALSNWLDISVMKWLKKASQLYYVNIRLLNCGSSFRSLFLKIPIAKVLLPKSYRMIDHNPLIWHQSLPRRICTDCAGQCHGLQQFLACTNSRKNPPIIEALIQRSMSKTARIFCSFTELEHEVKYSPSTSAYTKDISMEEYFLKRDLAQRSFIKSLKVQVRDDESTRVFREATANKYSWQNYIEDLHQRKEWSPFFLSNLDWDWNVAGALEQLYVPDGLALSSDSHVVHADTEGVGADKWYLKTTMHTKLPNEIRIPYLSKTGDIKYYRVFVRDAEVPGDSNEGRTSLSDYDDYSKEQRSVGTAEVDMCAGESSSSGTQCFIGEITGVEGNDATPASEVPSDSGPSLDFQECATVSWSAQDFDGRPVLPCANKESECKTFTVELAIEADGENMTSDMSAKSTQVPPKGNDPTSSFTQHTSFAAEAPENQAFIEELDDEKDGDEGTTTSKISNELVKVSSNEIDSASAFTRQTRFAFAGQNGMRWFQIVGVVCASILLERLVIAMLGHFFGMGGKKV